MKKKLLALFLIASMTTSLVACGGSETTEDSSEGEKIEIAEVDENLLTMEVTIPAEYMGETTQEELNSEMESGITSITLNDDGSVTYVMTKGKHKEMMKELAEEIDAACNEMIGSEDYPTISAIEPNDDYTSFTVSISAAELGFNETFSMFGFFIYGGLYNSFNGTPVDNIHVDFVNADTNEIMTSVDSKDAGEGYTQE